MKRSFSRNARKLGLGAVSLLFGVLCAAPLDAQSISITSPAANAAVTGWTGNTFAVSMISAPSIVKVCYTVDAYPAYNPGIDAPTALGCSIRPPFSYPYNSYWNLNGPHQAVATGYDALGNVVATSAAVPFTTANNLPVSSAPSMTIATGTPLNANWSGFVSVTPTLAASTIPGDSLTFSFFIDGVIQASATNSTAAGTASLNTAQFQNGQHTVCVEVNDNTTYSSYPGGSPVITNGAATEWCRAVTFANGSAPAQALLNEHEIFLAPTNTFTLTAKVLNADGSTTSTAPVYQVVNCTQLGQGQQFINAVYYGSGSSDGCINLTPGVATVNSSGVVTAVANGAAVVNVMVPTITLTDLAVTGQATEVKSMSHSFTYDENGWLLNVTGGSCRHGVYQINLPQGTDAFVGGFVGSVGTTGCTATLGPTRSAWVYVWPTNTIGSFGQDGSIQSSYVPGTSFFMNELFSSLAIYTNDPPYNSPVTANCPGAWPYSGVPCGAAVDLNVSGFNTLEMGIYPNDLTGAETGSAFQTALNGNIASAENFLGVFPKFRGLTEGASFFNSQQPAWALVGGNESSSTFIGSQTGLQYTISQYMAQGNILGVTTADEITGIWAGAPLEGPFTFSNSGTVQSALKSITALNSGTCAALFSPSYPSINLLAPQAFVIHGSVTSGMNSAAGTTYHATYGLGAAATSSISGGSVTVTVNNGGSNYYVPPAITLVGGDGTYTSATAIVNSSGQVTAVTVTGSTGYNLGAPVVVFNPRSTFAFSCPGVANGTYNASNDPGLTIEPYAIAWYNGNTSYTPYDVWASIHEQANAVPSRKFWFTNPPLGTSGTAAYAAWGGNSLYTQAQSIRAINSVADAGDFYDPFQGSPYIASRKAAIGLLGGENQGYWFRSLYGAYDPTKPFSEITAATGPYWGWQGYPVAVASCAGNTITFSQPHLITNIIPGLTKLWITGATDGIGAVDSCSTTLASGTATLSGTTLSAVTGTFPSTIAGHTFIWNGQSVTVSSWSNSTTVTLSQAVGNATAQSFSWTESDFMILSAPTPTTLTVALGATNFSCPQTGCGTMTGTATLTAATTITWTAGAQFPSSVVGHIMTFNGIGGAYVVASWQSATQVTLATSPGGGTLTGLSYTVWNGGTVNWQDGTNGTVKYLLAAGTPTSFGAGNQSPGGQSISGYLDGDQMFPVTWSSAINRKRAQTFTLTGVGGTTTAPAPTSACLISGSCNFSSATFVMLPENTNWATLPASGGTAASAYRELPVLKATGGTAYIVPDLNYHKGISGTSELSDLNPGYAFGSVMECLLTRCAGQRAYKPQASQNGYWDQIGFTLQGPYSTFATTAASNQFYIAQHFENNAAVPTFWAMSHGSLMATRLAKYLLQPSLNSPDCGFLIECAARAGSYGDLFFAFNASDGAQPETFTLTPYEAAGQNIIRYVVNDHSISGATIISAGASTDTITLQPEDAVFYVFPASFPAELQQPVIAARLADIPSATKVVVRFAYDRYYLDSAVSNVFDCGTGTCTPPWDRNIGTVYYRLIYLGSNSAVLATSDVQTF